ncbi:hypothetical protein [Citromicrobium sp. JLT1363]|uniref:hypothetical protein n=1 Tax=Citromicrobium sp. JLT1363 TaxID=517722 RepID=UPI000225E01F|nr:hypothetical protein [Citromicrobium sp. JLT1363]
MLILTSGEAIGHAQKACANIPSNILDRYAAMIETEPIAWLFIIQPGDSASDLATVRQRPFECWEFIERSEGWFEIVFIISDLGEGHVVLVPDQAEIDATLLTVCRKNAEQPKGK